MTPQLLREWASTLTFATGCIVVIFGLIVGRVITKPHHDEAMALKDEIIKFINEDCDRGWREADKARNELAANNATLEKALEALQRVQQPRRG